MQGWLDQIGAQLTQLYGPQVVRIVGALSVLVLGWLVALLVALAVRAALKRTTLDERLATWMLGEKAAQRVDSGRWLSRGAYYLILLFTLVGFFSVLNLTLVSEPLTVFLNRVVGYAPRLLAAGLLTVAAWLLATILRRLVRRSMDVAKLDERLGVQAGLEAKTRPPVSRTFADVLYWLVFLLFLPAVLESLSLEGLLAPVQGLLVRVLAFLPNVLAAGVILGAGWLVARIVQRIVTHLAAGAGLDRVGERVGLAPGIRKLSELLGTLVYVLILIPVVVSALGALTLDAVTRPASNMLDRVMSAVPSIFAAALLLGLAYVAARLAARLVAVLLAGAGFDRVLVRLGLAQEQTRAEGERTPSEVVASLVVVAIMLFATIEASRLLGFESLAALLASFVVVAGRVLLGLIVFGIGLYLAGIAGRAVQASGSSQAALLATATRTSIVVLGAAVGLRQMGLANEIIELAFGILLGAIAAAVALAFGLGAREAAGRQVEIWLQTMKAKER